MIKLNTSYDKNERLIIQKCADDSLEILSALDKQCYLLNVYGEFTFEECFGKTDSLIESEQRYKLAKLRRVLKYYKYYLIEDEDNIGEWYIGTEQKNGVIEGRTCCENLQFAFEII